MLRDNREFDVDELKRLNRVEDVVADYGIGLRRVGRGLVGLCPFHNDRDDPNLTVYPDSQSWCCYACPPQPNGKAEGGDVIRFVEKIERLQFKPACRLLEERGGRRTPTADTVVEPKRPHIGPSAAGSGCESSSKRS